MREIKFRGRHPQIVTDKKGNPVNIDLHKWVYGDLVQRPDNRCNILTLMEDKSGYYNQSVHPDTVGQYTGFKDKNGVDIYEGDVLKAWFEDEVEEEGGFWDNMFVKYTEETGFVLWGENMTLIQAWTLHDELKENEWEVIGNIHDNPNLIKE